MNQKFIMRIIFFLTLAGLLALALWIYRNDQFDKGTSALKAGDYAVAMDRLAPLAKFGDTDAQFWLGQMYAFGLGISRDEEKALQWFRRAAKWASVESDKAAPAAYYVAIEFVEGAAVQKDDEQARKWLKIAAEGGSDKAAKQLGQAYAEGKLGLSRDVKQAEYWFSKAE